MAAVNDDASGAYTCTPHNSYGTMGPSGSTDVIVKVRKVKNKAKKILPQEDQD